MSAQMILDWMVADMFWTWYFFMYAWICEYCSQMFEISYTFEGFIKYLYCGFILHSQVY